MIRTTFPGLTDDSPARYGIKTGGERPDGQDKDKATLPCSAGSHLGNITTGQVTVLCAELIGTCAGLCKAPSRTCTLEATFGVAPEDDKADEIAISRTGPCARECTDGNGHPVIEVPRLAITSLIERITSEQP